MSVKNPATAGRVQEFPPSLNSSGGNPHIKKFEQVWEKGNPGSKSPCGRGGQSSNEQVLTGLGVPSVNVVGEGSPM